MSDEIIPLLSERELQVLQMVATGRSNQQIARQLVISVNTVKVHLRNIFEKLGVQSRTEATLRAIQEGWVAVADDTSSEPTAAPLKTYLLPDVRPAVLAEWKHIYFVVALVLALVTAIIPLNVKNTPIEQPYVPILNVGENSLYQQPPTPTPPPPQNNRANRWSFQSPLPTHRAGLGVVAFEGRIYAIGGAKNNNQATRALEIYDPATDSWSEGANKLTAAIDVGAAVLNNKIYVPGGCTNERQALDILEIYDAKTDRWVAGLALPQARCGYGLAALKDELYLFGGWDGHAFQDTIFVFSASRNRWEVLKSKLPAAAGYMGADALNDTIYIAGGYDGKNEFNQTYMFDPKTGQWQAKAPMHEKRGGFGLISAEGQLYAIGGGWSQTAIGSEKYDPAANAWTAIDIPFTDQWRNAGVAAIDTKIYAIGGWNGTKNEYMDAVVSYQVLFQLFLPISVSGDR